MRSFFHLAAVRGEMPAVLAATSTVDPTSNASTNFACLLETSFVAVPLCAIISHLPQSRPTPEPAHEFKTTKDHHQTTRRAIDVCLLMRPSPCAVDRPSSA